MNALVTGATSGIGRATALALWREGYTVLGCGRRQERLEALSAESGGAILGVRADLRREEDILAVFQQARGQLGGVDVLVNNAGLGRKAPLIGGETEAWREMLEVNILALCIATREAVRDMRRRGDRGHIVHISSMSGHRVPPGSGVYGATKFAVRSLTESLRRELHELESRIRVTAISPGLVETEFARTYHGDPAAARETYGRFQVLEATDIAEAVLYALRQPEHVQVHDLLLRPTRQQS